MLLPTITLAYLALLGLMSATLVVLVIRQRYRHRVGGGDGGVPELAAAVRAHGNFIENAPLCILLIGGVEVLGWSPWIVHALGAVFVVGRGAIARSLSQSLGPSLGRTIGTASALTVKILAAGLILVGVAQG